MFRIKICGITNVSDARLAVEAEADAIGLNFYRGSRRFVEPDQAESIVRKMPKATVRVGIFVSVEPDEINAIADRCRLDLIQLHGDEPPEFIGRLGGRPVMRALACGPAGIQPVARYLARCRELGTLPHLVLLDALAPETFGGSGRVVDWNLAAEYRQLPDAPPLVLAGGLSAENVRSAVAHVRPAAVDVASGVESTPGVKDAALMRSFVLAARQAFAALDAEHVVPREL